MHVPASSVSSDRDAIDYPACHCRWCQRETGTAHALNALYEADRVGLAAWKFLQRLDDVAVSAALGAVHVLGDLREGVTLLARAESFELARRTGGAGQMGGARRWRRRRSCNALRCVAL
jgi:hypothetical protein